MKQMKQYETRPGGVWGREREHLEDEIACIPTGTQTQAKVHMHTHTHITLRKRVRSPRVSLLIFSLPFPFPSPILISKQPDKRKGLSLPLIRNFCLHALLIMGGKREHLEDEICTRAHPHYFKVKG